MLHDRIRMGSSDETWWLANLSSQVETRAALGDREDFPQAAFDFLRETRVCAAPPIGKGQGLSLLRLLAAVGRGDLGVGRLFEGHVNALDLVRRFGASEVRRKVETEAGEGALFGVWNTDEPGDPLLLESGRLEGRKNFASGVDGLSYAIVTVPLEAGRQMVLAPLDKAEIDRSWWKPLGMKSSGSHVVGFSNLAPDELALLGKPDDYIREPWFSGGAIRFAAVHVGGMEAVMQAAVDHLRRTGRADNPYQLHRIGRMGLAVQSCRLWLDRAAGAWDAAEATGGSPAEAATLRAVANGFRSVVEQSAMAVLEEAERAVGAAGFNAPHRLERLIPDLRTYLRQPNPDGALSAFAQAVLQGDFEVGR